MNKLWPLLFCAIIVISTLLHYKNFSKDLVGIHVWRQTQTQSTINSFYKEDMNILHPRKNDRGNGNGIFRMEFPLEQWLVACTYKIFGQSILITRIWMFIIGLFSVLGMYRMLFFLFKNEFIAASGAWAFNFSPAFFYYTINPLPDNLALAFSIWGMYFFFKWCYKKETVLLLLSSLLLSAGALCKLPFILYFIVPFGYFLNARRYDNPGKNILKNFLASFAFVVLPLCWYAIVISGWTGNGIVQGVLDNKASLSTILDYFLHNAISTLPELLLNYGSLLFFLAAFYFIVKHKAFKDKRFFLFAIWGLVITGYFAFEINMITTVHDYYLFPFYPLLFILVGYGIYYFSTLNKVARYVTFLLLLMLPVIASLRMRNAWNENTPGFNHDFLLYKNDLQKAVPDTALCIAGNDISHFIFLYYIDKKGWVFDNNNYDAEKLSKAIADGAAYLYSDTRKIDTAVSIQPFIEKLITQKGSVKVFQLKQPNRDK